MAQSDEVGILGVTRNHDVLGICRLISRFIEEVYKSGSNDVPEMTAADQARLQSYLDNLRSYTSWVQDQPTLDTPKSTPREFPVEAPIPFIRVENEAINSILILLSTAHWEMLNSASSRGSNKLESFDQIRLTALIDKTESFLNNYVKKSTPVDMPESAPSQKVSGPGRLGV